VAGAAAPVVGPAAGTINLFGAGKGEDAAGAGFPAGYNYRESDTNAYAGGAPVNKGHLYYIFGVAVEFEDIEVFGAGPAFNTSIPAWVYANTTGTGAGSYYERMMRAISHNVAVKFLFANTAVNYDMGTLADWPSMSGLIVSESARVGQPIVGAYIPLQSVLAVNSRDESRKLTVQLNIERQVTVENDPNNPTVAAAPTTLSALVKMRLWGLDLCSPDAAAICGVKTGPEELATLLAAIQNNPALAAMLSTAAQK
jgi:hypothetical protein